MAAKLSITMKGSNLSWTAWVTLDLVVSSGSSQSGPISFCSVSVFAVTPSMLDLTRRSAQRLRQSLFRPCMRLGLHPRPLFPPLLSALLREIELRLHDPMWSFKLLGLERHPDAFDNLSNSQLHRQARSQPCRTATFFLGSSTDTCACSLSVEASAIRFCATSSNFSAASTACFVLTCRAGCRVVRPLAPLRWCVHPTKKVTQTKVETLFLYPCSPPWLSSFQRPTSKKVRLSLKKTNTISGTRISISCCVG